VEAPAATPAHEQVTAVSFRGVRYGRCGAPSRGKNEGVCCERPLSVTARPAVVRRRRRVRKSVRVLKKAGEWRKPEGRGGKAGVHGQAHEQARVTRATTRPGGVYGGKGSGGSSGTMAPQYVKRNSTGMAARCVFVARLPRRARQRGDRRVKACIVAVAEEGNGRRWSAAIWLTRNVHPAWQNEPVPAKMNQPRGSGESTTCPAQTAILLRVGV